MRGATVGLAVIVVVVAALFGASTVSSAETDTAGVMRDMSSFVEVVDAVLDADAVLAESGATVAAAVAVEVDTDEEVADDEEVIDEDAAVSALIEGQTGADVEAQAQSQAQAQAQTETQDDEEEKEVLPADPNKDNGGVGYVDRQHIRYAAGRTPAFWNHLKAFEKGVGHFNRDDKHGPYGNGVRQGQVDHKDESGVPEPVQPECEIEWETARVICKGSDPTPWQARW